MSETTSSSYINNPGVEVWKQTSELFFTTNRIYLLGCAALYLPSVFLLQRWMKNRKPLELTYFLRFWNLLLFAFSVAGTYYTIILPYLSYDGTYLNSR
jgi:hypothetical protein